MPRGVWLRSLLCGVACLQVSCGVGRGDGQVQSEDLVVEGCHSGAYKMDPDYFSSSPYGDSQTLRISRGDSPQSNSDSLTVALHATDELLDQLDEPVEVRPASGSLPAGIEEAFLGNPLVTMSFHLGRTCGDEVVSLQAISGTITFSALHNGEPNEKKKDRLIDAEFDVLMGDPRDVVPDAIAPSGYSQPDASRVTGWFQFYHRRGKPAQTFD
jgi:hypothetical protein